MQLENGNLYCWQWDTKQRLIIEEIDENLDNYIYIGNPKDKVGLYRMEIYDESGVLYCDIPDEILQFAGTANIYLSEVSADKINTTAFWRFTIKEREKPMDYVFYPTEQITIQMIKDELEETKNKVSSETIQEEIHKYFVDNPVSEQELDPIATKAIEKHNTDGNAHNNILKNKVDKVVGKQLSTNDFNNDYKLKLDNSITYQEQELTEEQKEQARVNIGAMSQNVSIPSIEGLVTKAYVDEQLNNKVNKEDNKGLSTNDFTNTEKAKLAGIEDGAQVNVQADYAQNDPTAPDYIKNRTHWVEYENGVEILPETTITVVDGGYSFETSLNLALGNVYNVNWEGVDYKCECFEFNLDGIITYVLGNLGCAGLGDDTGEPFIIIRIVGIDGVSDNTSQASAPNDGDYTLSIQKCLETVHKIDEKYLPETTWDTLGIKKVEIFNETVSGFSSDITALGLIVEPAPFILEEGKEYEVVWDGVNYILTAIVGKNGAFYGGISIGNSAFSGGSMDSVPFYIWYNASGDRIYFTPLDLSNNDLDITMDTHSIIIKTDEIAPIDLEYIPSNVAKIETAKIGQTLIVKSVDENGKPTEWETINSIKIDAQLSSSGQAADAKVVGEALAEKQQKGDYALKSDIIKELPIVTDSDNGKFLRVVAGQWAAQTIPNAEEASF